MSEISISKLQSFLQNKKCKIKRFLCINNKAKFVEIENSIKFYTFYICINDSLVLKPEGTILYLESSGGKNNAYLNNSNMNCENYVCVTPISLYMKYNNVETYWNIVTNTSNISETTIDQQLNNLENGLKGEKKIEYDDDDIVIERENEEYKSLDRDTGSIYYLIDLKKFFITQDIEKNVETFNLNLYNTEKTKINTELTQIFKNIDVFKSKLATTVSSKLSDFDTFHSKINRISQLIESASKGGDRLKSVYNEGIQMTQMIVIENNKKRDELFYLIRDIKFILNDLDTMLNF